MSLYFSNKNKILNELALSKKFLKDGYVIFDINKKKLTKITKYIKKKLKEKKISQDLNFTHKKLPTKDLNQFRMNLNFKINSTSWFCSNYYELAKEQIKVLCGNDLVMQRKVNLSIQFPDDDSSLLPLHSDVWTGCSPYECVLWVPLVDVYSSKSMYILSKNENDKIYKNFSKIKKFSELNKKVLKKAKWLNLKFGQAMIFNHQIIHGNIVNKTNETRWSLNCRFKSIFSPYGIKEIGETFTPLTLSPMTELGLKYEDPKI